MTAVQPKLPPWHEGRQPAVQALHPGRPLGAGEAVEVVDPQRRRTDRGDGDAGIVHLVRAEQPRGRQDDGPVPVGVAQAGAP